MSQRTKKVKSVGRLGARYGVRIRRRIREVEAKQKARHTCPSCTASRLRRVSTGIWRCAKCSYTFAGGAYLPETPAHETSTRLLREILEGRVPVLDTPPKSGGE